MRQIHKARRHKNIHSDPQDKNDIQKEQGLSIFKEPQKKQEQQHKQPRIKEFIGRKLPRKQKQPKPEFFHKQLQRLEEG